MLKKIPITPRFTFCLPLFMRNKLQFHRPLEIRTIMAASVAEYNIAWFPLSASDITRPALYPTQIHHRWKSFLSSSICRFCFSTTLSIAACTASLPPIINLVMISGSFSNRASSNSLRAFSLKTSRHRMPRESGQTKNRVARMISLYKLSTSRLVLVSLCRLWSSFSSTSCFLSLFTTCLSRSSFRVSGPLCKRRW